MRVLIIYARPSTDGHGPIILETVKQELRDQHIEYKTLDLYRMNYDPILHENEHYTAGNKEISKENVIIQKQIKNSDALIFIYPVWWYSMPAILKGFMDRVLTPGFAYTYKGHIPKGLLNNKALVFYTTGGPTVFYRLTGNIPKKTMKKILKFCGIRCKFVEISNAKRISQKRRLIIKKRVTKAIKSIFT